MEKLPPKKLGNRCSEEDIYKQDMNRFKEVKTQVEFI